MKHIPCFENCVSIQNIYTLKYHFTFLVKGTLSKSSFSIWNIGDLNKSNQCKVMYYIPTFVRRYESDNPAEFQPSLPSSSIYYQRRVLFRVQYNLTHYLHKCTTS